MTVPKLLQVSVAILSKADWPVNRYCFCFQSWLEMGSVLRSQKDMLWMTVPNTVEVPVALLSKAGHY